MQVGDDRLPERLAAQLLPCTWEPVDDPSGAPAAVLIPLARYQDGWKVLFTRRTHTLKSHSGQVSFPGGRWENDDSSFEETALRETEEEIGLSRDQIKLIGRLSEVISHRGQRIIPFVGLIDYQAELIPNPDEVARIFWVDLAWLIDEVNSEIRNFTRRDGQSSQEIFYQPVDGEQIWGLSAHILSSLCKIIQDCFQE